MMDKERKNRIEEVESFLRSGYCGDYRQREEAAEIIIELLDHVNRLENELTRAIAQRDIAREHNAKVVAELQRC